MATWSGATFGGWAPIETQGESAMSFAWNGKDLRRNIRYQKRMIQFQNEQSKVMSLWSAQNMPAATMRGLKAAGVNPLLVAGGSTNVQPMVASSAGNVPSNQSFVENGAGPSGGDLNGLIDLFSGTSSQERKARRASANALAEKGKADIAEQAARRSFFESDEGKKAVRDKLRMDYGPQSTLQAATLGAHSAGDAASAIQSAREGEGTSNQLLAWLGDKARAVDRWFYEKDNPRSQYYDKTPRRRVYDKPVDRRRYNQSRNVYQFNFGSSASRVPRSLEFVK